jgi:hypothetical protein
MKRLLALAVLVLASSAANAQVPAGGEFRVNTYTTGHQYFPAAAFDRLGNFVVVWSSYEGAARATEVKAQRYDAAGSRLGAEFAVNTATAGFQYASPLGTPIAMRPDGRFVVVWTSASASSRAIYGQRFDADGTRSGAEFRVDVGATVNGVTPNVAITPYGAFVVVWGGDPGVFMGNTDIRAQRFDASGNRLGAPFVVNTSPYSAARMMPRVALDGDGDFTMVWQDRVPIAGQQFISEVRGQRFAANGGRIGAEFQVNTYTPGRQLSYSLACGPAGDFIVSWDGAGDGSAGAILAQRYDATGAPAGGEFVVNSATTGVQAYGSVAADRSFHFVASWQSASDDGSGYSIRAQRFDQQGAPRGLEFRVNTYTTLSQNGPNVAVDEVGNFLVLWHSDRQDGSDLGAYAQRYEGLFPRELRVDDVDGMLEPGETVDMRPRWGNASGAARTFAGTLSDPAGPPGGVPQIVSAAGDYGTVPDNGAADCVTCYVVSVPNPLPRPVVHWDTTVLESITPDLQGQRKTWRLHVGATFADVPAASPFYRFVETLIHGDVTGGCTVVNGIASYCPTLPTSREQMAVFMLVAKETSGYAPPPCSATPVFADVPASSPFCPWIEELSRRGVVAGCGGGNYCPSRQVTREQMAVFVLRTAAPSIVPAPCVPPNLFSDVPETSPFCPWIEELALRGVVTGCGGGNYCPLAFVTREEMAVFVTGAFGLVLYGP